QDAHAPHQVCAALSGVGIAREGELEPAVALVDLVQAVAPTLCTGPICRHGPSSGRGSAPLHCGSAAGPVRLRFPARMLPPITARCCTIVINCQNATGQAVRVPRRSLQPARALPRTSIHSTL